MLEVVRINSVDYYQTLSKSEYYAGQDKGEPLGKWGAGVERLGIDQAEPVNQNQLEKLMTGFNPTRGAKLVKNAGAENMRVGMDLTFSAPKSVSVLWANADAELRDKLSEAHAQAISKSMEYLRERTETRTGAQGHIKSTPSALIYASFEHCDTREKDPNLHSHVVLSNVCISNEEGKTNSIDQKQIFENKLNLGTHYRAELGRSLREMGFKLEQDADPRNSTIFQIAGFNKDLEKHFSKRSETINKIAKETGITSARARSKIATNSKSAKTEIDRPALFERWQAESQAQGFNKNSIEDLKQAQPKAYEIPTTEKILEGLTEHNSYFKIQDLETKINEFAQYIDIDRQQFKQSILDSPELAKRVKVTHNQESGVTNSSTVYTSQKLIDTEAKIIDSAKERSTERNHVLEPAFVSSIISKIEAEGGFTLREEQRDSINHLTQDSGGVALLRGLAGSGKTTSLKAVSEAFKGSGYEVQGASISAQASGILKEETGLNKCGTVAQLLIDLDKGKTALTSKTVLVIDEAGFLGSRDFSKIQDKADQAGAKIILVGDEKQLQSVSAGGIFDALQRHAKLDKAELTQITRQKSDDEKQASKLFEEGRAEEALKIYEAKGQVIALKSRTNLMIKLASDYANDQSPTAQKMAISATNAECTLLNEQIRQELQSRKAIESEPLAVFENADGNTLELSKGDRVLFKKNSKNLGINNNQRATVRDAKQEGKSFVLTVEMDDGSTRKINSETYKDIRHAYAVTAHSSQGSTVEKSFVLYNSGVDLSYGYVAMTRHKEQAKLYCTDADRPQVAEAFSKANFKGTTLDLQEPEKAPEQAQAAEKQASTPTPHAEQKTAPEATKTAETLTANPKNAKMKPINNAQKINWKLLDEKNTAISMVLKKMLDGDENLRALALSIASHMSNATEAYEEQGASQKREAQHVKSEEQNAKRRSAETEIER